jgi:tetratricopeptide (TPR) repeat protein
VILRAIALSVLVLSLSGCATWQARSPKPSPSAATGRDPLAQWDREVLALFLKAQLLLREEGRVGAAGEAAKLLLKALERQPEEPLLWRYLGNAYAEVPDFERAAEASRRAVDMAPADGMAQFLLGQQLHRLGHPTEAEPHLRASVALGVPGDEPHLPHYYHYAVLKELRRVEEALSALDKWEEAIPDDRHPPALRARLLWDAGRSGEAAFAAIEALRRQPRDEDLLRMVLRYHRLDLPGAAEALEVVLEADWSVADVHRRLVDLYGRIGQVDQALEHLRFVEMLERRGGLDMLIERATLLLQRHDAEAVVDLLADQTSDFAILPHEVEVARLLAEAHHALGETEHALAILDTVQGPTDPGLDAVLLAARLMRQRGEAGRALKRLQAAADQLAPKDVEGRARLLEATLELEIERQGWTASELALRELASVAPRRALFLEADLRRAQQRREEALARISGAHEAARDDLSLTTLRADLLGEMGRAEEAVALYAAAEVRLDERLAPRLEMAAPPQAFGLKQEHRESMIFLLLRRSFVEHRAGDLAGTEATLRRVLDLQPRSSDALNGLAYLWADLGGDDRLEEAELYVRQALEQQPYSAPYLDTLGCLLLRTGELGGALDALEKANAYAPNEPEIQEHLADVLEASGELARALAVYGDALSNVDSGDVGQAAIGSRIEGKVRALQATGDRQR